MEKSNEKVAYYDKQPQLIKKEPSQFRDNLKRARTGFLIVVAGILLFFVFRINDESAENL